MRWLMLLLLVSLAALLIAAAGVARHIWVNHARMRRQTGLAIDSTQETDLEM